MIKDVIRAFKRGYKYAKASGGGKKLVRDEPKASIVQEALEGFASGRFQSKAEIKHFLDSFPHFVETVSQTVRYQFAQDMLTNILYAGYVEYKPWGITRRKGHHEGLITLETYNRIQGRLKERAQVPDRKDINRDFPLRGFVLCSCCGNPLTAGWTQGRNAKYPYYRCRTKSCAEFGRGIKKETIEEKFETILKSLQPSELLIKTAEKMFKKAWGHLETYQSAHASHIQSEVKKAERQIEQMLERIMASDSQTLIKAYEKKLQQLETEKMILEEKMLEKAAPKRSYQSTFCTAMNFLSNPYQIWASGQLENRRAVLKLAFADNLHYSRAEGFLNHKATLPFTVIGRDLAKMLNGMSALARPFPAFFPPKSSFRFQVAAVSSHRL